MSDAKKLDLTQLVKEFAEFQPDKPFSSMGGKPFVDAMAEPEPEFVIPFIKIRMDIIKQPMTTIFINSPPTKIKQKPPIMSLLITLKNMIKLLIPAFLRRFNVLKRIA